MDNLNKSLEQLELETIEEIEAHYKWLKLNKIISLAEQL